MECCCELERNTVMSKNNFQLEIEFRKMQETIANLLQVKSQADLKAKKII